MQRGRESPARLGQQHPVGCHEDLVWTPRETGSSLAVLAESPGIVFFLQCPKILHLLRTPSAKKILSFKFYCFQN